MLLKVGKSSLSISDERIADILVAIEKNPGKTVRELEEITRSSGLAINASIANTVKGQQLAAQGRIAVTPGRKPNWYNDLKNKKNVVIRRSVLNNTPVMKLGKIDPDISSDTQFIMSEVIKLVHNSKLSPRRRGKAIDFISGALTKAAVRENSRALAIISLNDKIERLNNEKGQLLEIISLREQLAEKNNQLKEANVKLASVELPLAIAANGP